MKKLWYRSRWRKQCYIPLSLFVVVSSSLMFALKSRKFYFLPNPFFTSRSHFYENIPIRSSPPPLPPAIPSAPETLSVFSHRLPVFLSRKILVSLWKISSQFTAVAWCRQVPSVFPTSGCESRFFSFIHGIFYLYCCIFFFTKLWKTTITYFYSSTSFNFK